MGTLALDPDLQDLASAIDALCSKEVDDTLIHTVADDISAEATTVTRSLAELGVVGLAVSERNGGGGAGLMGLAVAAETLGKKMVPGPTLPNALSAYLLDKAGNHDQVVELAESKQVRLQRLLPKAVYKEDTGELQVPVSKPEDVAPALIALLDELVPATPLVPAGA